MKDKNIAALFALFLGWFGIHRFYLRQPGLGVLYILLSFVGISFLIGLIDAIVLFAMDPEEFDRRYNSEEGMEEYDRYRRARETRDYNRTTRRRHTREARQERRQTSRPTRRSAPKKKPRQVHVPERRKRNPYKQEGIKKYKEFDLEGAIEDFSKGLEIDKRDVALHFNIACAYSLSEQAELAYHHIDKAVELGFKDFDRILNHDDLAYVRIQPQFDEFKTNGFRLNTAPQLEAPKQDLLQDDVLLAQLQRLKELREKGLITEQEFQTEQQKLMR